MRECSKCKNWKDNNKFYQKKDRKSGYSSLCKECEDNTRRERVKRQKLGIPKPEKPIGPFGKSNESTYALANSLFRIYGITLEDYNKMFEGQNGCCAICGRHQIEFKKRLSVDHCHKTGKVRGLLCAGCNQAIGLLQEDISSLKKAIEYLKENNI